MRVSRFSLLYLLCAAALAGAMFSIPAQAQGFGSSKKKVVLHRKLPPTAHLSGTTFQVQVNAKGVQGDIGTDLQSMLETELMKNDARLSVADKNPDTLITCTVTQFAQPKPTTSTESTYEIGSKKPVNETVTRYTGLLTVAYQAKSRGRTIDSENVTAKYDDEFNKNGSTKGGIAGAFTGGFNRLAHGKSEADTPPTDAELKDKLLKDVVSQIAARLVNTDEPVEVLLARGKLDDANKLAEAGLWSRNLETLETMEPFPNQEDDAYRLYNIGVAYEALGYAAEDPKTAKKDLDEAAINYGKAIDGKPSEKYFLTPQTRIETAIAHYKKLSDQGTVTASAGASGSQSSTGSAGSSNSSTTAKSSKSSTTHSTRTSSTTGTTTVASAKTPSTGTNSGSTKTTTPASKPAAKGPTLNNDQVIALVKAGLDEDNIIDTIRTAANVDFDLSVNGEINLANHGVKGKILTAMKQRARQGTHKASTQ